jgi:GTP-binding protein HflX
MWTHLEKFRGGIGMRGPGETQLETDRRLIGHRIKILKQRLEEVQQSRATQRQQRSTEFRAALVGYTNAGKSSVLRGLSGAADVFVEDRLFATLDPLTREVDVGAGKTPVLLTDTVGFIRKLPHNLVASFRATLEEVSDADLLLHVIDSSHPTWEEQRQVVNEVLAELGASEIPVLHVFNKIDALPPEVLEAMRERMANLLPNSVFVSAVSADGLAPLQRALQHAQRARRKVVELRFPASDGRLLAEVHRTSEVLDQKTDGNELVVRARVDDALRGRFASAGATVSAAAADDGAAIPAR